MCLPADRRTALLRFRMAELAQATGHSTRSLPNYLEEIRNHPVAIVYRAANQHPIGRIEICDRFWPYHKSVSASAQDPERTSFIARVRGLFREPACVQSTFSAAVLAADWGRAGATLDQVERAILLGCARKYVALFHPGGGALITSLPYFAGIVAEVAGRERNLNYGRYLAARVRKMENQWRAHANIASAKPPSATETK